MAAAQGARRELEHTRNELSAQLEELRATTRVTKDGLVAARDAAAGLAVRVAEAKASAEGARAAIVSSPEKVKGEVAQLEAVVAAEQRALDALDAQRRRAAQQLDVVAKADKDVSKALLLMGEAEAEAVKLKRLQKEEKQRKCEAEAVQAEVEALKQQLEQTLGQKRKLEEKLQCVEGGPALTPPLPPPLHTHAHTQTHTHWLPRSRSFPPPHTSLCCAGMCASPSP